VRRRAALACRLLMVRGLLCALSVHVCMPTTTTFVWLVSVGSVAACSSAPPVRAPERWHAFGVCERRSNMYGIVAVHQRAAAWRLVTHYAILMKQWVQTMSHTTHTRRNARTYHGDSGGIALCVASARACVCACVQECVSYCACAVRVLECLFVRTSAGMRLGVCGRRSTLYGTVSIAVH
jgi:hypothetical protein